MSSKLLLSLVWFVVACDPGSSRTPHSLPGSDSTHDPSASGGAGSLPAVNQDCAGVLFCEDFESLPPGNALGGVWQTQTKLGTVSVDSSRSVSGKQSAKFVTEAASGSKTAYLHLEHDALFPISGNAYYGRMMFWLESAPTESVHWTFIQAGGRVEGETYSALYRYGGQHPVSDGNQLMANYETPDSYRGVGPGSDCWRHSNAVAVPVGRWSCVEWHFDGSRNEMRLWLDGTAVESLTVTGTGEGCVSPDVGNKWTAPIFEYLQIGWESYQPDSQRTLFIDDLVLNTERIGCEAPAAPSP